MRLRQSSLRLRALFVWWRCGRALQSAAWACADGCELPGVSAEEELAERQGALPEELHGHSLPPVLSAEGARLQLRGCKSRKHTPARRGCLVSTAARASCPPPGVGGWLVRGHGVVWEPSSSACNSHHRASYFNSFSSSTVVVIDTYPQQRKP